MGWVTPLLLPYDYKDIDKKSIPFLKTKSIFCEISYIHKWLILQTLPKILHFCRVLVDNQK